MTTVFAIALSIAVALGAMPSPLSGQTLDPQSLIGEWSGTWQNTGPDVASGRGQYILTIKKIEGTKVLCHLFITSPTPGRSFQSDRVATLTGNHLSWGGEFATDFTVSGSEMNGVGQGGPRGRVDRIEIKLNKK